MVNVCLTGAFKVCKAFIPAMIESGGGSIILTSSSNAIQPGPSSGAYTAAKTGVVGLMKVLAVEAGEYNIRVNTVHPGGVNTKMLREGGTMEQSLEWRPEFLGLNRNLLPGVEWLDPQAISNAVLWLASDESKFVTGVMLPVDAGWTVG
jgi:NAD(P)-dependent dehydrogenase (short-subunit alcohol dehydrogenase family)